MKFQFARNDVISSGKRAECARQESYSRVECKVDKSNGVEIQINAALNDAHRIPQKGRERGRKDLVTNRRKERVDEEDDSHDVQRSSPSRSIASSATLKLFRRH